MSNPSRSRSSRRGIAAVEMAVILPVLLLVLASVWEYGRLIEGKQILANACREGGRAASTGVRTVAEVQQTIIDYLTTNNIGTNGLSFQIQNLTNSARSNPQDAEQLDRFRISVTIPADNLRWIILDRFATIPGISVTSDWYSMKDIPVDVTTNVPIE